MEETFSETSLFDELRDNLSEINSFRPFDLVFMVREQGGIIRPFLTTIFI